MAVARPLRRMFVPRIQGVAPRGYGGGGGDFSLFGRVGDDGVGRRSKASRLFVSCCEWSWQCRPWRGRRRVADSVDVVGGLGSAGGAVDVVGGLSGAGIGGGGGVEAYLFYLWGVGGGRMGETAGLMHSCPSWVSL
jgi:hypothetical protein